MEICNGVNEGICYILNNFGGMFQYTSLYIIASITSILMIAVPIIFGAIIISGIWWGLCTLIEAIFGINITFKDIVLKSLWGFALGLILYRATKKR